MRRRLSNLLRRMRREERGASFALVAVSMIAILGMTAFVIDVGNWYLAQRQLQNAADAAALAGAVDLPSNATQASTDAQTYVNSNVSGATATTTTPYGGDASTLQVKVTKTVPSIFGGVLGISSVTVSASAAAKVRGSTANSLLFAADTNCNDQAMTINGNNITVTGGTHSNGSFFQNANNGVFGPTTYGGPNNCKYTGNGNNNTFGGTSSPTYDATDYPWPDAYTNIPNPVCWKATPGATSYTCWSGCNVSDTSLSQSGFTWNANNATLPSGVYCTTGQINFNGNHLAGNGVTFIAGDFQMNSNNVTFTPASGMDNLLFYDQGTNTLNINGNSFLNLGTVFDPNGTINLNGNSGTLSGFFEGKDVTITGNSTNFVGTGPPVGGGSGATLVQ